MRTRKYVHVCTLYMQINLVRLFIQFVTFHSRIVQVTIIKAFTSVCNVFIQQTFARKRTKRPLWMPRVSLVSYPALAEGRLV